MESFLLSFLFELLVHEPIMRWFKGAMPNSVLGDFGYMLFAIFSFILLFQTWNKIFKRHEV